MAEEGTGRPPTNPNQSATGIQNPLCQISSRYSLCKPNEICAHNAGGSEAEVITDTASKMNRERVGDTYRYSAEVAATCFPPPDLSHADVGYVGPVGQGVSNRLSYPGILMGTGNIGASCFGGSFQALLREACAGGLACQNVEQSEFFDISQTFPNAEHNFKAVESRFQFEEYSSINKQTEYKDDSRVLCDETFSHESPSKSKDGPIIPSSGGLSHYNERSEEERSILPCGSIYSICLQAEKANESSVPCDGTITGCNQDCEADNSSLPCDEAYYGGTELHEASPVQGYAISESDDGNELESQLFNGGNVCGDEYGNCQENDALNDTNKQVSSEEVTVIPARGTDGCPVSRPIDNLTEQQVQPAVTVLGDCGCNTGLAPENICTDDEEDKDDEEEEDGEEVDLRQELYVDHEIVAEPYKKRKRTPKNLERPNCRKPRLMGAIERAMRSSSTRTTEHIFEPIIGMVFDSREEAREFYNMYSFEVGFGVWFNNRRLSGKGYRSMQEIVCQKGVKLWTLHDFLR